MKKQISVIAAITLLTLAACKKDKDTATPPPQQEQTPLIASIKKNISGGNNVDHLMNFVYDAENRLKEVKISGTSVIEKYSYTGSKVLYRYYNGSIEVLSAASDYILNGVGRAEATLFPYSNTYRTSEYNGGGYITRMNLNNGPDKRYWLYHIGSGNVLDSVSQFYDNGVKIDVIVFTYEKGKKNTIGDANRGIQFLSKQQAEPVKKSTLFNFQRAGLGGIRSKLSEIDYTYEYDSNNRIKKQTAVETGYRENGLPVPSTVKEVMEYTYKQ